MTNSTYEMVLTLYHIISFLFWQEKEFMRLGAHLHCREFFQLLLERTCSHTSPYPSKNTKKQQLSFMDVTLLLTIESCDAPQNWQFQGLILHCKCVGAGVFTTVLHSSRHNHGRRWAANCFFLKDSFWTIFIKTRYFHMDGAGRCFTCVFCMNDILWLRR